MRRFFTVLAAAVFLLGTAGCSLLGDDPAPTGPAGSTLEKPGIKVVVLPTAETAPLHLAQKRGLFREQGLEVQIETAGSGQAALTGVLGGTFDIAYSSFVPFIAAAAQGADIKIIAENSYAAPKTAMLVVPPGSPIRSVKDLGGKTVAVPAPNTTADLLVKDAARSVGGVDPASIKFVPVPFGDMGVKLTDGRGEVHAAMMVEPFLTSTQAATGAVAVYDLASGANAELPFTGYGATGRFARAYPRTVAAFQRAMAAASKLTRDRQVVEDVLLEALRLDPMTVKLMSLPGFGTAVNRDRIQRVAQLMRTYNVLKTDFEVGGMLVPTPQ